MIYHFILDHRIGGPHVYVDTFQKALGDRFQSVVITTGVGPMTDRALLNLRHFWAPLFAVEVLINSLWLIFDVLRKRIPSDQALFHVHSGANLAPLIAARITNIPTLWTIHETTPRYRLFVKLGSIILKGHKHKVAVVAKSSIRAYGLKDTLFHPAAVDTNFWSKASVSPDDQAYYRWNELPSGQQKLLRVLAVGNLNPLKGFDILLGALFGFDDAVQLKIVGPSLRTHQDYSQLLHQMATSLVSNNKNLHVDFLGWQSRSEVRALLASCDVFVLPSRSEGSPIALLEAMAMGCHIIAADVGDVAPMVSGCKVIKLFEAKSIVSCRQALNEINQLITDTPEQGSYTCIKNSWRLDFVSAEIASTYRDLVT